MQKRIIGLLQGVAQHKNRHRVFEDFITIVAVCLHNQKAWFDKKREEERLKIENDKKKEEAPPTNDEPSPETGNLPDD